MRRTIVVTLIVISLLGTLLSAGLWAAGRVERRIPAVGFVIGDTTSSSSNRIWLSVQCTHGGITFRAKVRDKWRSLTIQGVSKREYLSSIHEHSEDLHPHSLMIDWWDWLPDAWHGFSYGSQEQYELNDDRDSIGTEDWRPPTQERRCRVLYARIPLWATGAGFALYPATLLLMRKPLQRRRRRKLGLCTNCGYHLTGNTSDVCPECGTPICADG